TLILEQDGRAMILSNEQVGSAVVVEISRDDGARILELNFVEANVGSNVFEPIRSEIAEESDFAFVVFRLTDVDEINPAVVVVVRSNRSGAVYATVETKLRCDIGKSSVCIISPHRS